MVQSTATTIARGDAAPKRELGVNLGPDNLASTSLRVVLASGIIVKRDARMCDPVSVKNPFWRPAKKTIAPVPRDHFAVSSAPHQQHHPQQQHAMQWVSQFSGASPDWL